MPPVESGDELYRNYDCDFERQLSRPDEQRRMTVELFFKENEQGFVLCGKDEGGVECSVVMEFEKQEARSPQRENIVKQLVKWGNTPFEVSSVNVELEKEWFVPSSLLSDMRRSLCELLIKEHQANYGREDMRLKECDVPYLCGSLDYRGNVANSHAVAFYKAHGVKDILPAFEKAPVDGVPVMYCKHCIKYSMGWCSRSGVKHQYKEPFYIVSGDGKRFRLAFDCNECQMQVIAE
jgi:putative protease